MKLDDEKVDMEIFGTDSNIVWVATTAVMWNKLKRGHL